MKREYLVTITKHIKLKVNDDCLTPEAVREFSESIFPATAEKMMRTAAVAVAIHGDHFVEGIGKAEHDSFGMSDADITYTFETEEFEIEETKP